MHAVAVKGEIEREKAKGIRDVIARSGSEVRETEENHRIDMIKNSSTPYIYKRAFNCTRPPWLMSSFSFLQPVSSQRAGKDITTALAECDKIVEGEVEVGNQHHFYMETQAAAAAPTVRHGLQEPTPNLLTRFNGNRLVNCRSTGNVLSHLLWTVTK